MGEAEEVEGLRFAVPALGPIGRGMSAEFNQPGLVGVQFQREASQSIAKLRKEPCGVRMVLESNNEIVSVAHDNNVTARMPFPPLLNPEVNDVMQVDIREQR